MKLQTAIKKVLNDEGITQKDLAKQLKMTNAGISGALSEKKSLVLDRIFKYLDAAGAQLWLYGPRGQRIKITEQNISTNASESERTEDDEDQSLFPEAK